ncbi:hypothetical protein NDU88_004798 [Pleurodeles waltl]|uniref:Uncharacterized protein n=1 Tax=Pleurodeles waltl TaxID=8319 RepID=A0AAV7L0W7_PLEWA|nr:hypothetical protein NDU88_004798 [Pleurodeles waltl]
MGSGGVRGTHPTGFMVTEANAIVRKERYVLCNLGGRKAIECLFSFNARAWLHLRDFHAEFIFFEVCPDLALRGGKPRNRASHSECRRTPALARPVSRAVAAMRVPPGAVTAYELNIGPIYAGGRRTPELAPHAQCPTNDARSVCNW